MSAQLTKIEQQLTIQFNFDKQGIRTTKNGKLLRTFDLQANGGQTLIYKQTEFDLKANGGHTFDLQANGGQKR